MWTGLIAQFRLNTGKPKTPVMVSLPNAVSKNPKRKQKKKPPTAYKNTYRLNLYYVYNIKCLQKTVKKTKKTNLIIWFTVIFPTFPNLKMHQIGSKPAHIPTKTLYLQI